MILAVPHPPVKENRVGPRQSVAERTEGEDAHGQTFLTMTAIGCGSLKITEAVYTETAQTTRT